MNKASMKKQAKVLVGLAWRWSGGKDPGWKFPESINSSIHRFFENYGEDGRKYLSRMRDFYADRILEEEK